MRIIAVTGRSGSGKSAVGAYYARLGYAVLDADRVSREVLDTDADCRAQLAEAFGTDICGADGVLNRALLHQRAFASQQAAQTLTQITHPAIVRTLLQRVSALHAKGGLVFVDGAVIVGALFAQYCDKIVVVSTLPQVAQQRIMRRDGISQQQAQARLSCQMSDEALRAAADYIIENNTTEADLYREADKVLRALTSGG